MLKGLGVQKGDGENQFFKLGMGKERKGNQHFSKILRGSNCEMKEIIVSLPSWIKGGQEILELSVIGGE